MLFYSLQLKCCNISSSCQTRTENLLTFNFHVPDETIVGYSTYNKVVIKMVTGTTGSCLQLQLQIVKMEQPYQIISLGWSP